MTIEDDVRLAILLLGGFTSTDAKGLPETKYLERGGPDELAARKALACILLSGRPIPLQIRRDLAKMLDPDCDPFPPKRTVEFKMASRGKPPNAQAATTIAQAVWERVKAGSTVSAAIDAVGEQYAFSDSSTVKKVWLRYRKILRIIDGGGGNKF